MGSLLRLLLLVTVGGFLAVADEPRLDDEDSVPAWQWREAVALREKDLSRLAAVLQAPFAQGPEALTDAFHAATGLAGLGKSVPQELCAVAKQAEGPDALTLYKAGKIADLLSGCKLDLGAANVKSSVQAALATKQPQDVYRALAVANLFGVPVDTPSDAWSALEAAALDADTVGTAHVITAALELTRTTKGSRPPQWLDDTVKGFSSRAFEQLFQSSLDDVVALLQGLNAAAQLQKDTTQREQWDEVLDLLVGLKDVTTRAGASRVAVALGLLAARPGVPPLLLFPEASTFSLTESTSIAFKVTDPRGLAPGSVRVVAEDVSDSHLNQLASDIELTPRDSTTFLLDASKLANTPRGVLLVQLSARLQGEEPSEDIVASKILQVAAQSRVQVTDVKVAVREGHTTKETHEVTFPTALETPVYAEVPNGMIAVSFQLLDPATKTSVAASQVFVQLVSQSTMQEITFVAQPLGDGKYKYLLSLQRDAGLFVHQSGLYEVHLIVGDVGFEQSLRWQVGTVDLQFQGDSRPPQVFDSWKDPLPVFEYKPAEPTSQAPSIFAQVLAALTLAPVPVLFVQVIRTDATLARLWTASTVVFHSSLVGCFAIVMLHLAGLTTSTLAGLVICVVCMALTVRSVL